MTYTKPTINNASVRKGGDHIWLPARQKLQFVTRRCRGQQRLVRRHSFSFKILFRGRLIKLRKTMVPVDRSLWDFTCDKQTCCTYLPPIWYCNSFIGNRWNLDKMLISMSKTEKFRISTTAHNSTGDFQSFDTWFADLANQEPVFWIH